MKPLAIALAVAACLPAAALADRPEFSRLHPEEQYSDNGKSVSMGAPYEDLLKRVQEKLRAHGFDGGPANGNYSTKLQAALAQFQLANSLPASGSLDDATILALGIDRGPSDFTERADRDASGAPEKAERDAPGTTEKTERDASGASQKAPG